MSFEQIKGDKRYKAIFKDMSIFFENSIQAYIDIHNSLNQSNYDFDLETCFNKGYIIKVRYYDAIRATALDIYRYAAFHNIGNDEKSYSISESIYASYAMKWIATFHPLAFDTLLEEGEIPPVSIADIDIKVKREPKFIYDRYIYLCNEYLAIICASMILNPEGVEEVVSITEAMNEEEEDTLIYGLRYRLKHQDAYTPLLKRIQASLKNHSEN